MQIVKSKLKANFPYIVEVKNTENWNSSMAYLSLDEAKEKAKALQAEYRCLPIRIKHCVGGPMGWHARKVTK